MRRQGYRVSLREIDAWVASFRHDPMVSDAALHRRRRPGARCNRRRFAINACGVGLEEMNGHVRSSEFVAVFNWEWLSADPVVTVEFERGLSLAPTPTWLTETRLSKLIDAQEKWLIERSRIALIADAAEFGVREEGSSVRFHVFRAPIEKIFNANLALWLAAPALISIVLYAHLEEYVSGNWSFDSRRATRTVTALTEYEDARLSTGDFLRAREIYAQDYSRH
jgi:hypothetical protein